MKNRTGEKGVAHAMAFYHEDGLTVAWQQAAKFADKDGRMATMPDIVQARLKTKPGETPWETYYTTLTAEYLGLSRKGNQILIVAHGIGPMSTLSGIQKTYSWEYKDKSRIRRGGRILQQEFWDLEDGKFGEVNIVDFNSYCRRYDFPFLQVLRSSEAMTDPVLKARLGSRSEQYVQCHTAHARAWHREQPLHPGHVECEADGSDPFILRIEGAANCCYTFGPRRGHRIIEEGYAVAHLISTGRLCHLMHNSHGSLVLDVGCHEWGNGTRIVGIQSVGGVDLNLQNGPRAYDLLRKHWKKLLLPVPWVPIGFRALMKIDEQWFTQYPKTGEGMDTWEPEHAVTSMEEIGKPILFRTTVGGYYGFFKFGTKEVQAIAPLSANAYFFVGEPQNEWHDGDPTHQTCMVQFCRVTADTTKRLIRGKQLSHDFDLMMRLLETEDGRI